MGSRETLVYTVLLVWLVWIQALFWMMLIALHPMLFLTVFGVAVAVLARILDKREQRQLRNLIEPQQTQKPFTQAVNEYLELLET